MTTAALATATALLFCELVLRIAGFQPWPPASRSPAVEVAATMVEADRELGWRERPGRYDQPPYAPEGTRITTTILADDSRATAAAPPASPDGTILLVGASFTFGSAVSDADTFAWKLQARWPRVAVVNHGAAGYGTLQSLTVLERTLPTLPRPAIVLYGFITHHEERNVATSAWLELLATQAASANAYVPYATLAADGTVVRHAPTGFPELPLRRESALVTLVEQGWVRLTAARRTADRRAVTEALLLAMRDLAVRQGVDFAVVLLTASREGGEHYVQFLPAHGVDVFDCAIPVVPALRVPGEIHPNGVLHGMYADCIAANLARRGHAWLPAWGGASG